MRERQVIINGSCLLHFYQDKVDPGQLASLMKTEWQLSYVTPLYQFRYTQLKSYARQLSAFMAAEKQQVEDGATQSLKVSFSVVHGLVETDFDAETILIQVSAGLWILCSDRCQYICKILYSTLPLSPTTDLLKVLCRPE